MKKKRGILVFAAAGLEDVGLMQENGKKILRQVLLIQSLVFVLILGGVTASLAATTCGAPSTCVVTIDNYWKHPYRESFVSNTFTGVDHSCSTIGLVYGEILLSESLYWHNLFKWYWNGAYWTLVGGLYGLTPSAATDADYANDTGTRYGQCLYPQTLFPNGCSDLPSQQPDQSPNPDTGDPKCNSQVL